MGNNFKSDCSNTWRGVMQAAKLLKKGLVERIGHGRESPLGLIRD